MLISPHTKKETNASNAGLVARPVQTDKQLQQIKPGLRGSKAEPGNSRGRTLPTRVFAMASTLELYLVRTACKFHKQNSKTVERATYE